VEYPGGWSALTASLAVADLGDAEQTWRFLRACHLVSDSPDGAGQLARAITLELERGRITGGTVAFRVAGRLIAAGLALPAAATPDPFGQLAAARWARRGMPGDDPAG
jgi:hypothetical protein